MADVMRLTSRWLAFYLSLCHVNAAMSKDPSTKVGAVIARPGFTVAGMGWNGFPRGCDDKREDYENRDLKLSRTLHAEVNAILNSNGPVKGCVMFVHPFPPCDRCAAMIIQAGITAVVCPPLPDHASERWADSVESAMRMFSEAGVDVHIHDAFGHETEH